MNDNFKNKILPILLILVLVILIYIDKNKTKQSIVMIRDCGKIYDYQTTIELSSSYSYKFFYKDKMYKGSLSTEIIDKSKIGKCFEILVDPNNPTDSQLSIDKELDCNIYNDDNPALRSLHYKEKVE